MIILKDLVMLVFCALGQSLFFFLQNAYSLQLGGILFNHLVFFKTNSQTIHCFTPGKPDLLSSLFFFFIALAATVTGVTF